MTVLRHDEFRYRRRPPESINADADDVVLVVSARTGDLGAFAALYLRHRERTARFCRSRLGDAHDSEDATQEAFLRAWRALDTFGHRGSFYPWLHAIARNVCTDLLRKRPRVQFSDDGDLGSLPDRSRSVVELLDAKVDHEALCTALARLSRRHREILVLREFEGWTYEQIERNWQLERQAVKSLLWRARQALRREFLSMTTTDGSASWTGCALDEHADRSAPLDSWA